MFNPIVSQSDKYAIITNFPVRLFIEDIEKRWGTSRLSKIFEQGFIIFGSGNIKLHIFFLPEFYYMLSELPKLNAYDQVMEQILTSTWMKSINTPIQSRVNVSKFKELNYFLKPYQREFISLYDEKKQKYLLNGYILAFEQGLGKTFTSLALMHSLSKDCVIVIAPKSTLKSVWEKEINKVFSKDKSIWTIGDKPKKSRFYIVNYESMDKLDSVMKYIINSKNTGIVIDESHNFRSIDALRVNRLISIINRLECKDVLFMSGTPIKAIGSEMIPILKSIDPLFDEDALKLFKKIFGINVPVALDIMRNRLGMIMYRKLKSEVVKLPNKTEKDIYIKLPDGDKYILENVKLQVYKFMKDRKEFYSKNYHVYEKQYDDVIHFCEDKLNYASNPEWVKYRTIVRRFNLRGYTASIYDVEDAKWANNFERSQIIPHLPVDQKKKFIKAKSVIKYVDMTIMGEVIGGLLNKLRSDMYQDMLYQSNICELIKDSKKKTVCFTTFVDVAEQCYKIVKPKCGYEPLLVYGKTSHNISEMIEEFEMNEQANPLIATIQTLSTGVTLTSASTVIFINPPWRMTDYYQASDRIHRIGQDTDVIIYKFILDTGGKGNLSTRMEDIIQWSKEMFEGIVGGDENISKIMNKIVDKYMR